MAGCNVAVSIIAALRFIAGKECMGKRDMADRQYFSDCRRFAELVNIMLYHGRPIVLPENLVLQKRKYPSLSSGNSEIERDVLMEDVSRNICYGLEIETVSDLGMPERVMIYDACEYAYQVKEIDRGHRTREDYAETQFTIARHMNITSLLHKMEKEDLSMCKAFNDLMEEERREGKRKGKKEGKKEGKQEGRREEKFQTVRRMLKSGCDEAFIRKMTNCTKEEFTAAAAGRG